MKGQIRTFFLLLGLFASAFNTSSLADPLEPTSQSKCEISANSWRAQHPNVDPVRARYSYFGKTVPPGPPLTYRDPESGTTFYAESDGRHLAAIGRDGRLLWIRNPFVEGNLCPYRSAHPYIAWIGSPGGGFGRHYIGLFTPTPDAEENPKIVAELDREVDRGRKITRPHDGARFIAIAFNSSQMGYIDIESGDFYPMGQD